MAIQAFADGDGSPTTHVSANMTGVSIIKPATEDQTVYCKGERQRSESFAGSVMAFFI